MSEESEGPLNTKRLAAEFVVIVVGVLVALGVDGWRETRQNRAEEARLLASIEADLVADSVDIAQGMASTEEVRASLLGVRQHLSGVRPLADANFITLVEWAGWLYEPRRNSGTYGQMVSTGSISVIRDQDVKNALAAYEANWTMTQGRPELLWSRFRDEVSIWIPSRVRFAAAGQGDDIPRASFEDMAAFSQLPIDLQAPDSTLARIARDIETLPDALRITDQGLYETTSRRIWLRRHAEMNAAILALIRERRRDR